MWFGNESKRVVGNDSEEAINSRGNRSRKNKPGKLWNKRLVAAEVHDKRLKEIRQIHIREYTGDGLASLRTYAGALTELIGELSAEELVRCHQLADAWNKQPNPKDIQRKCVTGRISSSGYITHTRTTGQPKGFRPL